MFPKSSGTRNPFAGLLELKYVLKLYWGWRTFHRSSGSRRLLTRLLGLGDLIQGLEDLLEAFCAKRRPIADHLKIEDFYSPSRAIRPLEVFWD